MGMLGFQVVLIGYHRIQGLHILHVNIHMHVHCKYLGMESHITFKSYTSKLYA